jgi:ABC-type sugar transport system substrate-binding protein
VEKAQGRGIKVICWDTDAPTCGRTLMVNQVDDQALGESLIDEIAGQMDQQGKWAIVIASLDAANLNTWRRFAEAKARKDYPKMELVDTVVTQENVEVARQKVETLLNKHPDLKGLIAFDSNSVPGAAEALKRTGRVGEVALTGNSMPEEMRAYVKDGVLEAFYLWDPRALGELTVRVAVALVRGETITEGTELPGYGKVRLSRQDPTMLILSDPLRFHIRNIDKYDFSQ